MNYINVLDRGLENVKRLRKLEIEKEYGVRLQKPVEVRGKEIDADDASLRALTTKLAEIDACIAINEPLEGMVWRLADNSYEEFNNIREYRAYVVEAIAAVARRNREAREWAWAEKAKIDAATTPEEADATGTLRQTVPAAMAANEATAAVPDAPPAQLRAAIGHSVAPAEPAE